MLLELNFKYYYHTWGIESNIENCYINHLYTAAFYIKLYDVYDDYSNLPTLFDIYEKNIQLIIIITTTWNTHYHDAIFNIVLLFQKITRDSDKKVAKATAPFTAIMQSYGYN